MNSTGISRKIMRKMTENNNRIINPGKIKFDMGCVGVEHPICNQKTRLCKNWSKLIGCPFGANCHYAHSVDELRIMDCAYARECVFVSYTDTGECVNTTSGCTVKLCYFRHPGEDDIKYHERLGNIPGRCAVVDETSTSTSTDRLTPIKIDINPVDTSWSTVVRKNRAKKAVKDVNPYLILGNRQTFSMPDDRSGIYDYIKDALDNKVTTVKFDVTYN